MLKKTFLAFLGLFLLVPGIVFAKENRLPYQSPDAQLLTQGYNTDFTHRPGTKDAYALDFVQNGCESYGDPILSIDDGEVHLALEESASGGYGNMVDVIYDKGIKARYAHMINFVVAKGDQVKQGQVLGYQGDTGFVDGTACAAHPGTHLHFAIYTADMKAYKPEPMSGYTNFTAGNWYTSDNELYDPEIAKVDITVTEGKIADDPSFWSKVGGLLSGAWDSLTASVSKLGDQLFVDNDDMVEVIDQEDESGHPEPEVNDPEPENKIYSLELISQTQQNLELEVGETVQVSAEFKNTGNQTWRSDFVSLNIDEMKNTYPASFYHNSWFTSRRPTRLDQVSIEPNQTGSFSFDIKAPENLVGQTVEIYFRPVLNSGNVFSWLGGDERLHWNISVVSPELEDPEEDDSLGGPEDEDNADDQNLNPFAQDEEEQDQEQGEQEDNQQDEELDEESNEDLEDEVEEEVLGEKIENENDESLDSQDSNDEQDVSQDEEASTEDDFVRRRRGSLPEERFYLTDPDTGSEEVTYNQEVNLNLEINSDVAYCWATEEDQDEDIEPALDDSIPWYVGLLEKYNLSDGQGLKKVYLWVRDSSDNLKLFSDEIDKQVEVSQNDYLKLVINEVAWAGTADSPENEWIELYNTTDRPIDLSGWQIRIGEQDFDLSGSIPGNEFLVITRSDGASVLYGLNYNYEQRIYWENELANGGDYLDLRNPSGEIVDYVDCSSGWFAGGALDNGAVSMERVSASSDSASSNWASYDSAKRVNNYEYNGTPQRPNTASLTGTADDYTIISQNQDGDLHLTKAGSPYLFDSNIRIDANLIIDPGVVVRLPASYGRYSDKDSSQISVLGSCNFSGTSAEPIVITSYYDQDYPLPINPTTIDTSTRNHVYYRSGGFDCQGGAEISHTEFKHARNYSFSGNVSLNNSSFSDMDRRGLEITSSESVNITNNTFNYFGNKSYQGHLIVGSAVGRIENNNFNDFGLAIQVKSGTGLHIANNSSNIAGYVKYDVRFRRAVGVIPSKTYPNYITSPTYWGSNSNMIYYIFGSNRLYDTLEIAPGVVVKFSSYDSPVYAYHTRGALHLNADNDYGYEKNAQLIAHGSAGQPIVFTADMDTSYLTPSDLIYSGNASGKRIYITSTNGGVIDFDNVMIDNAAQYYHGPFDKVALYDSLVKIDHTSFGQNISASSGHFLTISNPLEGSYLRNSDFGIEYQALQIIRLNYPMEIKHNNFVGLKRNHEHYVRGNVDSEGDLEVVDLTENWWGNASGPAHEDNPEGMGNSVYGQVNYSDWGEVEY